MTYLYLDIETVPDGSRKELWGLPEPPEVSDIDTILGWKVDAIKDWLKQYASIIDQEQLGALWDAENAGKDRSTVLDAISRAFSAEADLTKELSVDPERCRVVAVGYARGDEEPDVAYPSDEAMDEEDMLRWVWNNVLYGAGQVFVGYNILAFDLPVICTRSILLGVRPTVQIDWRKYNNPQVVDLMLTRFAYGKAKSLKVLAEQYGIEVPCPDVDGSMVHQMTPDQIAEYVKSDVVVTRELHRRFAGFFCPPIVDDKEEDLF